MTNLERIKELMNMRGWSVYRLSKKADVLQSTLSNMFSRNNDPSISTLESICRAFGITMSEFFSYGEEPPVLTLQQIELLNGWEQLSEEQKQLLLALLKNMKS